MVKFFIGDVLKAGFPPRAKHLKIDLISFVGNNTLPGEFNLTFVYKLYSSYYVYVSLATGQQHIMVHLDLR